MGIQNGQRVVSFGPDEVQIPPPIYSTETINSEILNPSAPRRPATPFSKSIPNMIDLEYDTWSNYTNDNNNRAGSFLSLASVFRPIFRQTFCTLQESQWWFGHHFSNFLDYTAESFCFDDVSRIY
jgi:hypothetical protein